MSSSGKENYPKPTSGPLFAASQQSALKFDLLPPEIIEEIFAFLDQDSQRHYAMIKSSKNKELDNRLMQAALVNHFLNVVAEGRPPQYELSDSKEDAHKPGILTVNLEEEEENINYTVRTPEGEMASGTIKRHELINLRIRPPQPFNLETIKTILPDILEITAVRGHTYTMGAEKLLAIHPELKKLLLQKGNVTDYAGNHFTNITAFQYAIWAKDRHMWSMLAKNMDPQEVTKQLSEMKEDAFKSQHGSYWDCPKEYDLNYIVLNKLPALNELKENKQKIPTLIKIPGKKEAKFYIYGNSDDGRTPQLKELDPAKISNDVFKLEAALKEEKNPIDNLPNTKKYRALHAEIEQKEGHFVNPLSVALQEFIYTALEYAATIPLDNKEGWDKADDHLDELWFKVGEAQRTVPVHIPNEYCCPDRSFSPTSDFKEASLPRICKTSYRESWFPLCENAASCMIYLRQVDKTPTLDELKAHHCKIPMLIRKTINDRDDSEYYLYAFKPGTKIPTLSSAFKEKNTLNHINFRFKKSHWLEVNDTDFLTLSRIDLTFSLLGLNFGFSCGDRGREGVQSVTASQVIWEKRASREVSNRMLVELLAVSRLCHERTLEVKQFIEPLIATSTKSPQMPTQSLRTVSR